MQRAREFGDRNGGILSMASFVAVLGSMGLFFSNLYSFTDQRYYPRESADAKFATKERLSAHSEDGSRHMTYQEARMGFPTREEIEILNASNRREFEELKSLLLRVEGKLDASLRQSHSRP